jgi:glycolate oxidase iron-sulfur subunit
MQTKLSEEFRGTPDGEEAEAILRKCVHCGFCNATCPTYQVLGDELDGPRGRIYLIKQLLEGGEVTRSTQVHLDRCLTCRNCETTCPSGVEYGHLVEIGRRLTDERVDRPPAEQATRWLLKEGLTSPLFAPALKAGRMLRPLLPQLLKSKIPSSAQREPRQPRGESPHEHSRKVLLLGGCVQPAMRPQINAATVRVLDAAGIQTIFAAGEGCCGALRTHLNDRAGGLADMRRNIDAWWPHLGGGAVEAVVANASACSQMTKEYGYELRHDPDYADKARRVAALTRDLSEYLPDIGRALEGRLPRGGPRVAFHAPCTLQHGQELCGVGERLTALGFDVKVPAESHLCCGSAGTYSVLHPEIANELRDRKLGHLNRLDPECIVSANIGCIQHLQSGTPLPVRHWIEVIDEALAGSRPAS